MEGAYVSVASGELAYDTIAAGRDISSTVSVAVDDAPSGKIASSVEAGV